MFRITCKTLVQNLGRTSPIINCNVCVCYLRIQTLKSKSFEHSSSFTVSYLMNSCGFSFEDAINVSKKVSIKISESERPDSVLELLMSHGFSKTQVTKLLGKDPLLLLASAENLKPKFEYLESVGVPRPDIAKILSSDRAILRSSLTERIIPNFNFLRTYVGTDENLVATFKQSSRIATCSLKIMETNISTLKAHGVPEVNIMKLVMSQPITLMQNVERFVCIAREVKEMGFDPTNRIFVFAVHTMLGLSQLNWERKIEIFKSFGWSKNDALSAFRAQPNCMLTSEEKIRKMMDFFLNKLGFKPLDVARHPNLLLFSMERRVLPRCAVLKVLKSKGLLKKKCMTIISVLHLSKINFEDKFVTQYQEIAPEVLQAYMGKTTLPELELGFEDVIQV